ncbi:MAG: Rid family hydrolase, partial [Candidatus Bathyarchaeota archaeon]
MVGKIERFPIPKEMLEEWWGYPPNTFYSSAVKAGPFTFLGGEVGIDYKKRLIAGWDFETQCETVFKNLAETNKAHGISFENYVQGYCYVTDIRNAKKFVEIAKKYLPDPLPFTATFEVKNNRNRWCGMTEGGLIEFLPIIANSGQKVERLSGRRDRARATKITGQWGTWIFVSGEVGMDYKTGKMQPDAKSQAHQIFTNIRETLKEYGATIENIVQGWCLMNDVPVLWHQWIDVVNEEVPYRPPPMVCIMEARNRSNGWVGTTEGAVFEYCVVAYIPKAGDKIVRHKIPDEMNSEWWGYKPGEFYSAAIEAGPFVFLGGEVGINYSTRKIAGDDFKTQAREIFKNIKSTLKQCGTSIDNVVSGFCMMTDVPNQWYHWIDIVNEEFPMRPPPMV